MPTEAPSPPSVGNHIGVKIDQAQAPIHIHLSEKEKSSQSPPLSNKFDLSRLPKTDATLFGREDELALIDQAWQEDGLNVLVLIAMGGAGKTALMQKWIDDKRYCGADAAYAYSFYLQGSSEDKQASAAEFFDSALRWFGHDGSPIRSEHERGAKLAELVCRQRTLLVLDGMEPLQHPLGGPMNGALKDKGLISLCKQLAANGNGLLLISSRQPVMELDNRPHQQQHELKPLKAAAGIALFRAAGIIGTDTELAAAVEAYNGHALSLSLLATYLREYEHGDIRQQDTLRCLTEFPEETYGSRHAFKVMAGHERKLVGRPELQILFCLGLFDRPVSAGAMSCLRKEGILSLPGDERVFRAACERLRRQGLLNTARPEHPQNLDTHPLVRQYFGRRLAELHPESWQQAHVLLYEYFKAAAKELPDTLEEMEPLFAAVRHGFAAGLHQKAMNEVYWPRILRKHEHYLLRNLGAFSADLALLSNFFAVPWHTPAKELTDYDKVISLNWASARLRALGRLHEAIEPMQAGKNLSIKQEYWREAAQTASNLSELLLTLGDIAQAVEVGRQSVALADKKNYAFDCLENRTALANALHQAGELAEARDLFIEAEHIQKKFQPEFKKLYSLSGFRFCELFLDNGIWQKVQERSNYALNVTQTRLDIALNQLSLSRALLQEAIAQADPPVPPVISGLAPDLACVQLPARVLEPISGAVQPPARAVEAIHRAVEWLDQAVDGLREAGTEDHLPRGLLARAAWGRWAAVLLAQPAHFAAAERDLQECEEIAQRGGMQLHLIDCHLEAARLALASGKAVLAHTAAEHLAAAQDGIAKTGYKRRLPEVENIEELLPR